MKRKTRLMLQNDINELEEMIIYKKRFSHINLIKLIEDINETLGLVNINSEVFIEDDVIFSVIESPNHTTITINLNVNDLKENKDSIISYILHQYQKIIQEFDIDEVFNELWSDDFANRNQFKPSEFIKILESDMEYFNNAIIF
ncbi:hypothetical protein [Staphylococcus aureus]|uniref:hypothetical protein n=1 Tax=Staphylococcus aureus TaxID=1280 RepID=UPI000DFAB761|nr:hypothetical protein [Staphylococcus aureus]SUL87597.1 Uncharacterised protein [Staphylococcus aureus]